MGLLYTLTLKLGINRSDSRTTHHRCVSSQLSDMALVLRLTLLAALCAAALAAGYGGRGYQGGGGFYGGGYYGGYAPQIYSYGYGAAPIGYGVGNAVGGAVGAAAGGIASFLPLIIIIVIIVAALALVGINL